MKNEKRRMKNEKRKMVLPLAFCLLLFTSLLVLGCDNPFNGDGDSAALPAGKGAFSLTLNAGRTILPATPDLSDFAVFNLDFTPTSGGTAVSVDRDSEDYSDTVLLDPGTYTITVNAYKDSGKNQLMARGTLTGVAVAAAEIVSRTITLEALLSDGTGTFSWSITLPSDVTTANMTITPVETGGTAEQTVVLTGTGAAGNRTLNAGRYNITFNLASPKGNVVWKELLYVYQNMESVHEFEFTDAHFINQNYTVTFDSNGGTNVGQVTRLHGETITRPANPTKSNAGFAGWFTDNDTFANAWNFATPVVESFTLYAKWAAPFDYIVTGSGSSFTATRGGDTIANGTGTLQNVITAIRTDADGADVSIQLGSGGSNVLENIAIQFNNTGGTWGVITLTGGITITSAYNNVITIADSVSVNSMANITGATSYAMISNNGTLAISAGTISATGGSAVNNAGTGTVEISGGNLSATTGNAVNNAGAGTVEISSGVISATTGNAVNNAGAGTVKISGGAISATTGNAARNNGLGLITVSGTATLTSENTTAANGTIYIANSGSETADRLIIAGGTVENTSTAANGNAVYNLSTGGVSVIGGAISAPVYAVQNTNATGAVTLGGSPDISGRIRPAAAGKLSVITSGADTFTPGARMYTLDYASYTAGAVGVTGGAGFMPNFALNTSTFGLNVGGSDLVFITVSLVNAAISGVSVPVLNGSASTTLDTEQYTGTISWSPALVGGNFSGTPGIEYTATITLTPKIGYTLQGRAANSFTVAGASVTHAANSGVITAMFTATGTYVVTGSGNSFTAATGGGAIAVSTGQPIQTVMNAIRDHATGTNPFIQFGTGGTNQLNIGANCAGFNNTGGTWGAVTLTGSVTSTNATATEGTVAISGAVAVTSRAAIANTVAGGRAIYHNGSGVLTISNGTVSATNASGVAVYNAGTGSIQVSGDATVTSASTTATEGTIVIANGSSTPLTISGGTVQNTANNANGRAIYHGSSGAVAISGGTVSANTGIAVYNAGTGSIQVSGDALVTSANTTSATGGTISIASGSSTPLTISGGTVQNTASSANGRAIYHGSSGAVAISGGTVSVNTGVAVYNAGTGSIQVSGTALVTSASTTATGGTIFIANTNSSSTPLTISGGTVQNTANDNTNSSVGNLRTINHNGTGTITISGGTVSADSGIAVFNAGTGVITVSGTAQVTSASVNTLSGNAAIRIASSGTATAVRLNILGGTVSSTGSNPGVLNQSTGAITINGGTVSANTGAAVTNNGDGALSISNSTISSNNRAVGHNSSGTLTISNSTLSAGTDSAVYKRGANAALTISSGTTLSSESGTTVDNAGSALTISGGNVSSNTSIAVESSADVTISGTAQVTSGSYRAIQISNPAVLRITGGTVETQNSTPRALEDPPAVYSASGGAVYISGGTVNGGIGPAVYIRAPSLDGTVEVSGTAVVTSANNRTDSGTIHIIDTNRAEAVVIKGGTVLNTATSGTAHAVYNTTLSGVAIAGGTISVGTWTTGETRFAVRNTNAGSYIGLGGAPTIIGPIRPAAADRIQVATSSTSVYSVFNPASDSIYTIWFETLPATGSIIVRNGASWITNFTLIGGGLSIGTGANNVNIMRFN